MGSRFVVFLLALVAVVAIITGIFLYRKQEQQAGAPQAQSEQKQAEPATSKEPEKSASAEAPEVKQTEVPSFDVVRVEPTGEGVIAGRAAPGWTVRLESAGATVGEAKADDEGAWTIILDKPLAAGDQALTLKAISPDGTRGVTSQTPVKVAVGPSTGAQPEPIYPDPNVQPEPPHRKPPVRIGKVEYRDTGANTGTISLSGDGDANERVFFFFDDAPLAEVTIGADGTWSIDIDKKLPSGEHTLRADTYDEATHMASGRASVTLGREPEAAGGGTSGPETAVAAGEPVDLSKQPQPIYPDGAPEASTSEPAASTAAAEPVDLSKQPQPVYPEGGGEPASVASAGEGVASSQPQPDYPDGAPDLSPSAGAPAGPAPQPYDLSSQPQPVVPQDAAEAQASPAASSPAPEQAGLSSQPQPVVPDATPEATTAEATPEPRKEPPVVFKSVDYQDKDADSGTVTLSGKGDPGTRIALSLDDTPLGEVIIGDDGTWKFEAEKKVDVGEHNFRADQIDEKTGNVLGRASIGIVRMEPPKEEAKAPAPEAAEPESGGAPVVAAADEAKPEPAPVKAAPKKPHRPRMYTVKRGDTLWEIAESYYGGGWRYRAIVKDNRKKIRDPRLIYPKQKFHIPSR